MAKKEYKKGASIQDYLLGFKRKEGEGGEAGFNNQKPTRQTYLFRHVTSGLTTKWAIEI